MQGLMQNPVVRVLALFAGAYTALNMLSKVSPLHIVATLLCGALAAIIWMANYNRPLLYSLSLKPGLGSVINAACRLAREQPPVDPSTDAHAAADGSAPSSPAQPEAPKLQLHSDGDFASASRQIKDVVKGHNDIVDGVMDQLKRNVQLRDNSSPQATLPPIGMFVFVGKPGLGKKYLASEIGYRLYKGSSVSILDVSDPRARGSLLVSEARANPYTTFILENFQLCPAATQEDLLSIVSGAPQFDDKSGARVSFRHCFFFLMVHRDAEDMERPTRQPAGGATGHTMVVDSLGAAISLDKRLAWSLHGVYPFVLPEPLEQAEVVAQIMADECRKYNVKLGRVDAAILAREVAVVGQHGGFEITPLRVSKLMSSRLAAAVTAKEQLVDLVDDRRAESRQSY